MPAVRFFYELPKDFSPERRQRIEERKDQVRQDMTLAEPGKAFSLTQEHAGQDPQRQAGRDLQDREPGRHADEHFAQFCPDHGW